MARPKHESMTRRRFLLFLFKEFNMSFKEYLVRRMRLRSLHIRCMACQTHGITFLNIDRKDNHQKDQKDLVENHIHDHGK